VRKISLLNKTYVIYLCYFYKEDRFMKALILHASGTNRDIDAQFALQKAGADAHVVHINELKAKKTNWNDYGLLVVPGGFSYADALGAGSILAYEMHHYFFDELNEFINRKKPVIGICNGFQVLVKMGVLPTVEGGFSQDSYKRRSATLTANKRGGFECRDVLLLPQESKCIWTCGMSEPFLCPVAHGEGRFLPSSEAVLDKLVANRQIVLKYARKKTDSEGEDVVLVADGEYPYNPNGSAMDIAGVCDQTGLIFGLMPHTENNVLPRSVDSEYRRRSSTSCLAIWKNGVEYAKNS